MPFPQLNTIGDLHQEWMVLEPMVHEHETSNNNNHNNNDDPHQSSGRCSEVELRRACGSQSLSRLQEAVQSGWTVAELDGLSGKSALQLAAWKGCLSNVVYLVQLGCHINNYSTATYSYGKTPIFFALTQSRTDVVEYLLQCPGIQVAIVNNKGQSVLSLAATHDMPNTILDQIQVLEHGQTWWNFRATHSDGLHYGDLDPRFLDRPLHHETDVITPYAINPTCHSTRKGNFARRNPHVHARERSNKATNIQTNNNVVPRNEHTDLVLEQKLQLKLALDDVKAILGDDVLSLASSSPSSSSSSTAAAAALLQILQSSQSFRFAWLSQLVEALSCHSNQQVLTSLLVQTKELAKLEAQSTDHRSIVLLLDKISQRLVHHTQTTKTTHDDDNPNHGNEAHPQLAAVSNRNDLSISSSTGNHPSTNTNAPNPLTMQWKQSKHQQAQALVQSMLECQEVQDCLSGLSMEKDLQHDDSNVLRLPIPVLVVTTVTQVLELRQTLLTENIKLVAMDTEWYQVDSPNSHPHLLTSTFQLALVDSNRRLHCYIVDIQMPLEPDYLAQTRNLIADIMESSQYFVLGFSVGHDIPMLEQFVGRKLQPTWLLDLQLVLAPGNDTSRLPSLKTCAALYSPIPLCKTQQCSDWGQRPLSQDQLNYAGLDAAVLLYLLAEYHAAITHRTKTNQPREAFLTEQS